MTETLCYIVWGRTGDHYDPLEIYAICEDFKTAIYFKEKAENETKTTDSGRDYYRYPYGAKIYAFKMNQEYIEIPLKEIKKTVME